MPRSNTAHPLIPLIEAKRCEMVIFRASSDVHDPMASMVVTKSDKTLDLCPQSDADRKGRTDGSFSWAEFFNRESTGAESDTPEQYTTAIPPRWGVSFLEERSPDVRKSERPFRGSLSLTSAT